MGRALADRLTNANEMASLPLDALKANILDPHRANEVLVAPAESPTVDVFIGMPGDEIRTFEHAVSTLSTPAVFASPLMFVCLV